MPVVPQCKVVDLYTLATYRCQELMSNMPVIQVLIVAVCVEFGEDYVIVDGRNWDPL
jgi:hypothetical protein